MKVFIRLHLYYSESEEIQNSYAATEKNLHGSFWLVCKQIATFYINTRVNVTEFSSLNWIACIQLF